MNNSWKPDGPDGESAVATTPSSLNGQGVVPVFPNSHILVPEFDLIEPQTIEEAAAALVEHGDEARLLAGGTDLLLQMKTERLRPTLLVSLGRVPGIRAVTDDDGLEVGAMASIRTVATEPSVLRRYAALAEACRSFSTVQIMTMGTIGGNICNASPAADSVPALLALDAQVRICSKSGRRQVPLEMFFASPGRTVLSFADIVESVGMPPSNPSSGSAFLKVGRVAADISKVSVAVQVVRDGPRLQSCRIGLGAVAPTPVRAKVAETILVGETLTAAGIAEVARAVHEEIAPITDVRSTAAYRRHVAGVLVGDAFRKAWKRAGGDEV